MAAKYFQSYFALDSLLDDDVLMYLTAILDMLLNRNVPLRHIPRIQDYVEGTIPQFTSEDYRYHFRLSKEMFEVILDLIAPHLTSSHQGGIEQTVPKKQLLVFLCYLSNQESMREISHYFGLSISTVHKIIREVGSTICQHLGNVIKWPDFVEQHNISREIQLQHNIPDAIGAVDGTHIRLASCPAGDKDYINRKSFPSMQLQIVTDNNLMIRHAYTGWPGSTHDARVFRNSSLFHNASRGDYLDRNKYVIGDSAYPLCHWLITPFKDNGHLNIQQRRFNRVISGARQVVERCIGHLKGRFRRLREITVHKPEDIVTTIISACILHNLCILHQDNVDDFIEIDHDGHPNHNLNAFRDGVGGAERRAQLMLRLR